MSQIPWTLLVKPVKERVIKALEIRDTDPHDSEISDVGRFNAIIIFVDNGLDQYVTVRVMTNHEKSTSKPFERDTFGVQPNKQGVAIFSVWLPWMYCTLTCDTAPTSGSVNVYFIKRPQ